MKLYDSGVFLLNGTTIVPEDEAGKELQDKKEQYKTGTISYDILQAHNIGEDKENLKIKFDAITSHDLFHTQIGVGNRLDGGRRCVKKYLWSFLRTAPAGQVRL